MAKYYIPHEDEFYIGFECEYQIPVDEVNLTTESLPIYKSTKKLTFKQYSQLLNEKKIRVKYLDANDIISLGFELVAEGKNEKVFKFFVNEKTRPSAVQLSLREEGDIPIVSLYFEGEVFVNNIICMNKSELRWILKRVKIL